MIKFPKWVNEASISLFFDYLKNGRVQVFQDHSIEITDSLLQKILWIADYFQIDDLQEKSIKEGIIPRITKENTLVFMNEAYKKLKASEECDGIWYELLNYSLEIASENLLFFIKQNSPDLVKLNAKLLEEMIERYIKSEKTINSSQMKELMDLVLFVKKVEDPFDLLTLQKKLIYSKSFEDLSTNIIWNLSLENKESGFFSYYGLNFNLSFIISNESSLSKSNLRNENQRYFKLFLSVSNEILENYDNLNILENRLKILDVNNLSASKNCKNIDFIFTTYFQIKLNEKEIGETNSKIKSFHPISDKKILLCEHLLDITRFFQTKTNILKISMKIDYIHSLALTFLSRNIEKLLQCPNIKNINEADMLCIVKNTGKAFNQEKILIFLNKWSKNKKIDGFDFFIAGISNNTSNALEIYKQVNWDQIKQTIISQTLNIRKIRSNAELRKFIESKINLNNITNQRTNQENQKEIKQLPVHIIRKDSFQSNEEMNLDTDRTNLIDVKNNNISRNIQLNSSSIIFKNKLLEQKKYKTESRSLSNSKSVPQNKLERLRKPVIVSNFNQSKYDFDSNKEIILINSLILEKSKEYSFDVNDRETERNEKLKRKNLILQEINIQNFIKEGPIGLKLFKLFEE